MNPYKQIRIRLGFTQAEMATYLGINLPQLGMAEIGKRNLPAGASGRMGLLELKCQEAMKQEIPTVVTERITKQEAETRKAMEDRAVITRRKINKATKKLTLLREEKERLILASRLPIPTEPDDELEIPDLQLKLLQRESVEKLERNFGLEEARLLLQIDVLAFEAKRAMEIMKP